MAIGKFEETKKEEDDEDINTQQTIAAAIVIKHNIVDRFLDLSPKQFVSSPKYYAPLIQSTAICIQQIKLNGIVAIINKIKYKSYKYCTLIKVFVHF